MAIVHHLDMPIMRQRAFHIAPGTENQIPITPTLYTANPQVESFGGGTTFLRTLVHRYQELSRRHIGLIAKTIALAIGQITWWKLKSSKNFINVFLYVLRKRKKQPSN